MLRFNIYQRSMVCLLQEFQYILCYGSTRKPAGIWKKQSNFNTSYVTVQQYEGQGVKADDTRFQYILCYGSTYISDRWSASSRNFNTSYVTVQQESPLVSGKSNQISIHLMLRFNNTRGKG